jgi:hypothetical protein
MQPKILRCRHEPNPQSVQVGLRWAPCIHCRENVRTDVPFNVVDRPVTYRPYIWMEDYESKETEMPRV